MKAIKHPLRVLDYPILNIDLCNAKYFHSGITYLHKILETKLKNIFFDNRESMPWPIFTFL